MNNLTIQTAINTDSVPGLIDDDLPEAPECWSLDDFADLLDGRA